MKLSTSTYNNQLLVLCLLLLSNYPCLAEKLTRSESFKFAIGKEGTIEILNKYGDIIVEGWENDSVAILIEIAVEGKTRSGTQDLMNRIQIDASQGTDYVSVKTIHSSYIDKPVFDFLRELADFDRSNVEIDYTLRVPEQANLSLENKFGDIFIDHKVKANIDVRLSHGDLKSEAHLKQTDMELSYGDFDFRSIELGVLNVKSGDIEIDYAANIRLELSGSDLELRKGDRVEIKSKRDDLSIDSVGQLEGNCSFSDIEIQKLGRKLELDLMYSECKVEELTNSSGRFNLKQKTSDVTIDFDERKFWLDVLMNGGDFNYPDQSNQIEKQVIKGMESNRSYRGGTNTGEFWEFRLNGTGGEITLK